MANRILFFVLLACPCDAERINTQPKADSESVPLNSLARLLSVSQPASAFQSPAGALSKGAPRSSAARMSAENLEELAEQLNPSVGFWDPLGLGSQDFWGQGNEATVGFLRHAEIKHGRVAMAAFVGYCLQSNGIVFPWKLTGEISFSDIAAAGSPPEQWDALPTIAKAQILIFIGFLEGWSESAFALENDGNAHYMRGGVPGKFPAFSASVREGEFQPGSIPHPVPFNLYDPFNLFAEASREDLDRRLLMEINNGRLAQLGIFAFLAEQKVPGAVPLLKGLVPEYAGEPMAAFSQSDSAWPFVNYLIENNPVKSFPLF